ncbi:type II secretion system protein [Dissulfurirhabdus thermomarina]|uniref:prepilin-type N-terminal cleavage/methylation domain-containing protein n=2 Tax=Dissulfurirhabdus thermomarina TaxID=1765737 RepID=UPI0014700481|nr:type II secretion system protein [Dissulfurirhabdus thermomarina]
MSGRPAPAGAGFTLLEVLVATAVTGIALGVLLSGFAMGHRQALRGDRARVAAELAEGLFQAALEGAEGLDAGPAEVPGWPGWRYGLDRRAAEVAVRPAGAEGAAAPEEATEVAGLERLTLTLYPPGGAPPFVLEALAPAPEASP